MHSLSDGYSRTSCPIDQLSLMLFGSNALNFVDFHRIVFNDAMTSCMTRSVHIESGDNSFLSAMRHETNVFFFVSRCCQETASNCWLWFWPLFAHLSWMNRIMLSWIIDVLNEITASHEVLSTKKLFLSAPLTWFGYLFTIDHHIALFIFRENKY